MSIGRHRHQVFSGRRRPAWRIGAVLVTAITLVASMVITTSASAANGPASTTPWEITANASPAGGTVAPGAEITYSLKVDNTAPGAAPAPVTVVDDVSSLLAGASITTPAGDLAQAGLVLDTAKGTLTWTPATDIAGGQFATTQFTATVDADAANAAVLATAATVQGSGTACEAGDACATALTVTAPEDDAAQAAAPESTAPETTAPETTAPETTAPETTAPETTAPETTAPETTAPETSASSTVSSSPSSGPSETASKTSAPTTTAPTTNAAPSVTPPAAPRAQSEAISPMSVPAPTPTSSVVTVKVGGDRTGITGVTQLAGVTLGLYANQTGGSPLFTCVSDSDGDCSFTVPNTNNGGANSGNRYWVRQATDGVPAGWFVNQVFRTGNSNGTTNTATNYAFQTPQLRGGQTYSSTSTGGNGFMLSSGNGANASGGIWQQSRNNPTLPTQCGLKVALVLDLSGSVGQTGNLANLKAAASTFTDALVGTPSSMALFSFSDVSPASGATQNYPTLTPVTTQAQANAFKARYTNWTSGGSTNWDRGLAVPAASAANYDVVVMITDGNPTVYNAPAEGPGSSGRIREMENAVFSANAVKAAGARVIAFGVGSGVTSSITSNNLKAISGPVAYNGSNGAAADYYQTSDYAAAGTALRNLALGNCGGTVTVVKQVVPYSAPAGSITGAQPAGGWTFGASATNSVTVSPASGVTATGTGAVNFGLTFPGGTPTTNFTATETQQSGYQLQQVGGKNAVCTNLATSASVTVTNSGALGFQVPVGAADAVSCTVYNRAPSPQADITLHKTWNINGTIYNDGAQPSVFAAHATLTGPGSAGATAQGWDDTRTGYTVGDTATVNETTTISGPTLCTVTSSQVTAVNGTTLGTPASLPYTATLSQASNDVTVTNTVHCDTHLTLVKQVANGPASPSLWTLSAIPPSGTTLSGHTGDAAVTNAAVTPNVTYQLAESDGDPRYVQDDNRTDLQRNPLSTGSMTCVQIDANGNVIPGYSDGINGGVSVPLGYSVRCTATNRTAELTLIKHVVNDNGGTQTAADWNLTATPTSPPAIPAGLGPQTVTGSETGTTIYVRPAQPYALSESGPAGYAASAWSCDGGTQSGANISVAASSSATCIITNDDIAPKLTLHKIVKDVDGNDVTATLASQWTLSAAGTNGFSGTANTAAVQDQTVTAGVAYGLSESGPAGYTASAWSCTGAGTSSASSVTPAPGEDITCTITNTRNKITVELRKAWVNGASGDTADLVINGAAAAPGKSTSTADGTVGTQTDTTNVATATVASGDSVDLAEAMGSANHGTYTVTGLQCSAGSVAWTQGSTSATLTAPESGDVTCTVTNTRTTSTVKLIKEWVNGAAGDTAALSINGATAAPGLATSTASGAAGTQTDTANAATATVGSGSTVNLAETLGGNTGTYTTTSLACTNDAGLPVDVSGWSTGGRSGSITAPSSGTVTCTIVNTRTAATITLVKQWENGAGGDTAGLLITGSDPNTIGSNTSTSDGTVGTQTDTANAATAPIYSGGTVTLAETLPAGPGMTNTGSYTSTISCTPSTGFTPGAGGQGGTLVVPSTPVNVKCTVVNTRTSALLTLEKSWINGADGDTADLTIDGGTPVTATVPAGGTGISADKATSTIYSGQSLSLAEVLGADNTGAYTSSISCKPSDGFTADSGGQSGTYVVPATPVAVTCTIVNERTKVQLTLKKHWENAYSGNDAKLTIARNGVPPADTIATVPAGGTGESTQTVVVDVFSGDTADLSEEIGGANPNYTTSLACDGGDLTYTDGATNGTIAIGKDASEDVTCTFTNTAVTPAWTVKKTSIPPTGTAVEPGEDITYTLTATPKPGTATATNVTIEDDLSQVLNNAVLQLPLPAGLTLSGTTLTWTIPALTAETTIDYTVTVNSDAAGVTLVNHVTPTSTGGSCITAEDCTTEHPDPKITKTFQNATQHLVGGVWDGSWDVSYQITVLNPSEDEALPYSLVDTPDPAIGTVSGAAVTAASNSESGDFLGDLSPAFAGGDLTIIPTNDQRSIPAASTDTYTVVVNVVGVPVTSLPSTCTEDGGVPNTATATVTQGDHEAEFEASDCGNLPEVPSPTVTKTVTSTTQQGNGSWTTVYDVAVTNPSATLATQYDLYDGLAFGQGITVNTAGVTGPSGAALTPGWDGDGQPEIISGRFIGPNVTEHYTVTVNATVTAQATPADRTCTPGEDSAFTNVAGVMLHAVDADRAVQAAQDGTDDSPDDGSFAEACAQPVSPELTKTAVSVTPDKDGKTWDVTYTLTVHNPSTATDDMPASNLVYSLTDTPTFDASVTVKSAKVAASSDGSGAVPGVIGTWKDGSLSIVSGRSLAAGATDTFTVVVNAAVPAGITDAAANCSEAGAGHGFFNRATATSGPDTFTKDACLPVPHWTLAKSSNPPSGSDVDAGSTITYTLTATNTSQAVVSGARATDTLPGDVTLVTPLPAGLTAGPNGTLGWAVPDIAVGKSVSVSYTVIVGSAAGGKTLKNVVAPTTPGGVCTTADGCTTEHNVKQLIVKVADSCEKDAAFLTYEISSKNVSDAGSLPVTVTWRTADGTVARVDTIPAGQLTGTLLWPGVVLDADGVAVGWPGWRALQASDFPLKPGATIYGTQIEDASLPSDALRQPMTVTFEMNPSATVTVLYPGVTPAGCGVPRDPNLEITKTASVSTVTPGQAFSYDIAVKNTSTLGVAYPVTLSDPIPANLKVTGITTAATGFPHWQVCAVTGADSAGYGGTLNCELSAALGVSAAAPTVTLAVTVAAGATGSITNTASTCWENPSGASAQKCASASATVTVLNAPPTPLPNTGAPLVQLGLLALLLLLGGGLLWGAATVRRRRPREQ